MKNVFVSIICVLTTLSACVCNTGKEECAANPCENGKDSLEVVLNIQRKVKPECVPDFKASFLKCKESTLQEPGCIHYDMYQSLTDSTEFFIAEFWKNDGELKKHVETPHLKQHLSEIKDMGDPAFKGAFKKVFVCPKVN